MAQDGARSTRRVGHPHFIPACILLPNGKVFYSGSTTTSMLFDPNAHTWTTVDTTIYSGTRTYGTSVLFPLTPANNYDPRVIIMGGGNPATATTEVIDLGASNPTWSAGPSMSQARVEMNAVILPTGKILALGGSVNDEDPNTASLNADLYDPVSDSFSSAGANSFPRLYHSVALLLPDATVWVAGGNPSRGFYESQMEIYRPAYLFNSSGGLATRPTITSAPSAISWNAAFTISTADAANISSVVLSRPGASTHAFDMEQRLVGMSFTTGNGTLTVTAPPNGNIAPPGYYMLFLVNTSGVPSVAKFVQLGSSAGNPAPTVTSISPASGTTAGGTAVSITGTGFLAGATVSLGGTAATGVTVVNSTTITVTTAAHAAGTVNVVVTNSDGQAGTLTGGYSYVVINPAPTVTSISPTSGTTLGGTAVSISGTGFLSGATVSVGGTAATGVTVVNSTTITATTAAHDAGAVSVVVTNSDGKSGTLSTGYTYVVINPAPTVTSVAPPSGTTAGGTAVNIQGTGFLAGAIVKLGGTAATGTTVVNSTTISATTPAHAAGAVSVMVTNNDSQSGTLTNGYTYTNPAPAVASVAPNSGTANGGTPFTITGTGFLAGATVKLGGTAATGVTVVNSTTITATTPAHSAGAVDVVVTNTDAQSGTLTNGYTYTATLALSVFPGDSSSATVIAGQTATYTLSLGGGGMSGSATLTCTGAPAHATCSIPASQTFDAVVATPVSVTVKTASRTIAAVRPPRSASASWSWNLAMAMLGIVILPGIRLGKRPLRRYLWLAPLTLCLLLASCGGGGSTGGNNTGGQQTNPSGTPAGTYTVNVTATSGSATQTLPLTLIVQ